MRVSIFLFTIFEFGCGFGHNTTRFTNECPRDHLQWKRRGKQFHCDVKNNITYHCILNSEDRLMEACLKKEVRQQTEGCPWILDQDGTLIFGATGAYSKCPGNMEGCPSKNHGAYFTDSLYLYPRCLVPKSCRNCSCILYPSVYSTTQTAGLEMHGNMGCSCAGYKTLMTIFILTTLPSIIYLIWKTYNYFREEKMKRKRNGKGMDKSTISDSQILTRGNSDEEYLLEGDQQQDGGIPVRQKGPIVENEATKWIRDKLKENIDGNIIKPLFLCGRNGCGKTTVARHCLGNQCYIIQASDTRHLRKSIKGLANSQSIELDQDRTHGAIEYVSKKLRDVILLIEDVDKRDIMRQIDPLLRTVQCIVTTHNANLTNEEDSGQCFEVKGLSLEAAKELFEVMNLPVTLNKDFRELIELFEGSPIDIMSAITFMKEKKLSVSRILMYIKLSRRNFENEETEGEKMFQPLNYFFNTIRDAYPNILHLVLALQFLSSEYIPICLFITMAAYGANINSAGDRDIDFHKAESLVNTFISALQEVSFGEIIGEDDNRKIKIPTAVKITIMKSSQNPELRRQLMFKLLKCMSWLFVKDHGYRIDHRRCIDLLPHAEELIHQFPSKKEHLCIEESLVYIQVCDQVRYTYEVLGHRNQEMIYARFVMSELENVFRLENGYFKHKFQGNDVNIGTIAEELRSKFKEIAKHDEDKISNLANEYIEYKIRSDYDQENLMTHIDKEVSIMAGRLPSEAIRVLREKQLIVKDRHLLARIFIYEILITALRTFGRFELVHEDGQFYRTFLSLIKSLAQYECNKKTLQDYKSIRSIGVWLMELEDISNDQNGDLPTILEEIEELMKDGAKYFKYGLFVACPNKNLNHKLRCKCLMLNCYRKLKLAGNGKSTELDNCVESIEGLFEENTSTCMKAPYSQKAKQTIVEFYKDENKPDRAISILEKYDHVMQKEGNDRGSKIKVTSRYDCEDIRLRCQCYKMMQKDKDISDYLKKFRFKIPEDEVEAQNIIVDIKNFESQSISE